MSLRLLDLAAVQPGHRVLDLATGIGEPALTAAQRVGQSGHVVAADLSPRMLDIARERAVDLHLYNVTFVQAGLDALALAGDRFDAVLCRWGVTLLPDLPRTLRIVRRLLGPTATFATADWERGPRARPLASLALSLAQQMFSPAQSPDPPAAEIPSVAQALTEEMHAAGFRDVRTEEHSITLHFRSVEACVQYLQDVSPSLSTLLADRTEHDVRDYTARLSLQLEPFTLPGGDLRIPNVTLCTAGSADS
ncbi:MAG TPA: methyltransferase domain-containing protein [Gemmatimonadales bacterium]|nr:methyltransferase domain-containing protein [Gemmatimonadales bacterium]